MKFNQKIVSSLYTTLISGNQADNVAKYRTLSQGIIVKVKISCMLRF